MDEKLMTLEEFKEIPDGEIFATGTLPNSPEGIFMTDTNKGGQLRWVAKKGWGNDWAVYAHWSEHSEEYVSKNGDKVMTKEYIQRCVPCTEEVYKLYRH